MQTYLNDANLKAAFLAEIAKHEAADALIKGTYGQINGHFRGCAIGCSLHSLNVLQGKTGEAAVANTDVHSRYEAELGLPMWLAYVEDHIFEHLPDDLAKTWPRRFAEAIPIGAVVDDTALAKMLIWALTDADYGVRYATDRDDVRGWIDTVATYIAVDAKGEATADQREAAARDARDARAAWAAWAAWAARDAWDAWAARDARDAWDARAARAAWAAWDAWDARAAWAAWDAVQADSGTSAASRKADQFYPALSEYVISLMRDLATQEEER